MSRRDNYNSVDIYLKSTEDIKLMEISCRIVADTLSYLKGFVKAGVETIELDRIAEDFILSKGGRPAFKGYKVGRNVFPYTLCISVDEVVVHGMPGNRKLKEGEIVSLDVGVEKNGFFGDSAVTYPVGNISPEKERLLKITEESLFKGIAQAVNNNKVYDISKAVQDHCEQAGYSLTRELVGHGIGTRLHEEPPIPNFVPALLHRNRYPNVKLKNGMAIAIEPMVHLGRKEVESLSDGWTVVTADGKPAAHFEHTIVVENKEPIILTLRD